MQQRSPSPRDLEINALAALFVALLAGVTALAACGAPAAPAVPAGPAAAVVERAQGPRGCAEPIRALGRAPQLTVHFSARSPRCAPSEAPPVAIKLDERELEPLAAGTTDLATPPLEADHVSLVDDSYGVLGP